MRYVECADARSVLYTRVVTQRAAARSVDTDMLPERAAARSGNISVSTERAAALSVTTHPGVVDRAGICTLDLPHHVADEVSDRRPDRPKGSRKVQMMIGICARLARAVAVLLGALDGRRAPGVQKSIWQCSCQVEFVLIWPRLQIGTLDSRRAPGEQKLNLLVPATIKQRVGWGMHGRIGCFNILGLFLSDKQKFFVRRRSS